MLRLLVFLAFSVVRSITGIIVPAGSSCASKAGTNNSADTRALSPSICILPQSAEEISACSRLGRKALHTARVSLVHMGWVELGVMYLRLVCLEAICVGTDRLCCLSLVQLWRVLPGEILIYP